MVYIYIYITHPEDFFVYLRVKNGLTPLQDAML